MGRTISQRRMEDVLDLDIRRLVRNVGKLDNVQPFSWKWLRGQKHRAVVYFEPEADGLRLTKGFGDRLMEFLPVVYTRCHFGGERSWWLCPACGERVAVLYAGSHFACRRCHHLSYTSQKETREDRAIRRAEKIRSRLGWGPGSANPEGGKPKGMHWDTFKKQRALHRHHVTKAYGYLMQLQPFRSILANRE